MTHGPWGGRDPGDEQPPRPTFGYWDAVMDDAAQDERHRELLTKLESAKWSRP